MNQGGLVKAEQHGGRRIYRCPSSDNLTSDSVGSLVPLVLHRPTEGYPGTSCCSQSRGCLFPAQTIEVSLLFFFLFFSSFHFLSLFPRLTLMPVIWEIRGVGLEMMTPPSFNQDQFLCPRVQRPGCEGQRQEDTDHNYLLSALRKRECETQVHSSPGAVVGESLGAAHQESP